jgi:hypothetical protein
VFPLQEGGTHGKRLPIRARRVKQKKVDPARFAYTMIKALTKEQRESFMKMVMEDQDREDFWNGEPVQRRLLLLYLLNMYK